MGDAQSWYIMQVSISETCICMQPSPPESSFTQISSKGWDERPSEDGWSLPCCCSRLSSPGVCSVCGPLPGGKVINVSFKAWWGRRDRDDSADAAFSRPLQWDSQITDHRCTFQKQVPHRNTKIMMTPLALQCCSLHLFQSPGVHQPDWSAVFSAYSVWIFLCHGGKALVSQATKSLWPTCTRWHQISNEWNEMNFCHACVEYYVTNIM